MGSGYRYAHQTPKVALPCSNTNLKKLQHLELPFRAPLSSNRIQKIAEMPLRRLDLAETLRSKTFFYTLPHTQSWTTLRVKKRQAVQMPF
jgi:hypothetical protein